jgi:hypothetical protein
MGGSGKRSLRSLPMVLMDVPRAIGKLRLPLPPIISLESRMACACRGCFLMEKSQKDRWSLAIEKLFLLWRAKVLQVIADLVGDAE